MSAEQALLDAYQEWYRLAKAAASAIQTGNIDLLRECQLRVQQLQPEITRLTCEVREEWRQSNAEFMAKEKQLRALVSGLMELTLENMQLIRQRRESARLRLVECASAGRNLKRLQSYASRQGPRWNSFS
jgi:hypothetical protein